MELFYNTKIYQSCFYNVIGIFMFILPSFKKDPSLKALLTFRDCNVFEYKRV